MREEQNRAGALEVLMPTIQSADLWRESGRYDDYGKEMLRIKDRHERDMLFGPTNEEMITEIFRAYVRSYKDLPLNLYHIQWKFRDEVRPRFGVMRGREFLMKDAYSFDLDQAGARHSYNRMFVAYLRTFARMGLKAIPMRADTGPIGGDLSHEFIILADTGESEVFCHTRLSRLDDPARRHRFRRRRRTCRRSSTRWTALYAATDEMHDAAAFEAGPGGPAGCRRAASRSATSSTSAPSIPSRWAPRSPARTARSMPVHMGSYGIGPSRLVAAHHRGEPRRAGIIWPEAVAPFDVALVN